MDSSHDLAEFLASRRKLVTPDQAGLPSYGARRVPGLRREEVASLAGVSVDYYRRLERGSASGVSDGVLNALAQALQLNDAERAHLFDLARAGNPVTVKRRRPAAQKLRPVVARILDTIGAPAIVRNSRSDYVGANALGRALYAPVFDGPNQPPNSARFAFLDPAAHDFYDDWERTARELVELLRSAAGRNPYDKGLTDLVGELTTRSPDFATWWAAHNVRFHATGTKVLNHPLVGQLELQFEAMDLAADDDLSLIAYSAEPGSRSAEALDLLASWTAPAPAPIPTTADPQES